MLCCAVLAQDAQPDFSGVVEGQVFNLEGLPLSQAAVCAYHERDGTVPCGQANDEGRFSVPIAQPGKYLISAWQEEVGYADTWRPAYGPRAVPLPEVVVEEGQARQSVLIYLGPKAGKLTGQVLDAETNQPIERGKIELRHETAQTTSVMALSYSKGQFALLVPTTPLPGEGLRRRLPRLARQQWIAGAGRTLPDRLGGGSRDDDLAATHKGRQVSRFNLPNQDAGGGPAQKACEPLALSR
jgi:hypothetical protein